MGVTITIGGTDQTLLIPFDTGVGGAGGKISISESIPGPSTAHFELWDLASNVTIGDLAPIIAKDTNTGKNLFQGIIQRRALRISGNYRIWTLDCVDLNYLCDTTLVGIGSGRFWVGNADGTFTQWISSSESLGIDSTTAQHLIAAFWQYGISIDTWTFVTKINTTMPDINWVRTTLRQALDDTAAASSAYTVWWIDQDARLHWTSWPPSGLLPTQTNGIVDIPAVPASSWGATILGGPLTLLMPVADGGVGGGGGSSGGGYAAPSAISDVPVSGTSLPYENFNVEWDYSGFAWSVYANGGTDYTYNSGDVKTGGTGWVGIGALNGGSSWMSRYLDLPGATTQDERNSFGQAALTAMQAPIIRGSCDVTALGLVFHAGQVITITNAISGMGTKTFPIRRCTTNLLSGTDLRRISLEWGTAPQNRVGFRAKTRPPVAKIGATQVLVTVDNYTPNASGLINVTGQLINAVNEPWPLPNKTVTWTCTVYNSVGADVTSTTTFTISPKTSVTDSRGKAATTLTVSATTGLNYVMSGSAPD